MGNGYTIGHRSIMHHMVRSENTLMGWCYPCAQKHHQARCFLWNTVFEMQPTFFAGQIGSVHVFWWFPQNNYALLLLMCAFFLLSTVSHVPFSCRHATISKFFGDKTPNCAGACDFCRNPKAVRAQIERAAVLSTKIAAAQNNEPRGPFGFDPDLYAGGKRGYGFER